MIPPSPPQKKTGLFQPIPKLELGKNGIQKMNARFTIGTTSIDDRRRVDDSDQTLRSASRSDDEQYFDATAV